MPAQTRTTSEVMTDLEALLIPFFAGATFILAFVVPAFIGFNRNWNVRLLNEKAQEFDRGYEMGRKLNNFMHGIKKPNWTLDNMPE